MITLITGGARSGKSDYALSRVRGVADVGFIATAQALDDDMRQRITRHKRQRPSFWTTYEEPLAPAAVIRSARHEAFILDCLTMLVSNLLLSAPVEAEESILACARDTIEAMRENSSDFFVVTNETGLGVVPDNALARRFRDLLGTVNRMFAEAGDALVFMVCGRPLLIPK